MAKRRVKPQFYRYTGGAHIHGVPARDLTAAEYAQYSAIIEEQRALTNRVLYEPVTVSAAEDEEVKP